MATRRLALELAAASQAEHAGLWFDRFFTDATPPQAGGRQVTPETALVAQTALVREPAAWKLHFERWLRTLAQLGAHTREMRVNGRMVVGLGGDSVIETAITLHRTYGVPVIPGSALKGLAAFYTRDRLDKTMWHAGSDAYRVLFGDTTAAGYVTFFDALYVPSSGWDGRPLHPDILTVHHPGYYQQGNVPPADWDSPTPVPFLTATGRYLLALAGPADWVNAADAILIAALNEYGIGAKTSSGYGRLAPAETRTPAAGRR